MDEDNYSSSVHCAYYGCFQFIKYKLNQIGHSYDSIDTAISSSKTKPVKLTTHGYPIDLMCKEINKKFNDSGFTARDIKGKVKRLRAIRLLSDYHNEFISFDKGNEAIKLSNEVISFVKSKL
ncbi:hypothetical protein FUA48_08370 [Flavobacterium alkalisoli]|uniref:HEPN domain-containing protein n=1 Tax=Flavobacterium alkalisoli TaxID=2602769 RepID=A0A5B9FRS4_9FLAO|nr:hypothetical protein [Flavobacterium alkalisoli]QEE49594.1 hypothetical protein FUA48_08370 [Flavobacterium alkalisoli]